MASETHAAEMIELMKAQIKLLEEQNKQLKTQGKLLEEQNKLLQGQNDTLVYIAKTVACAEMRQCQLAGQATDASRMSSYYLRGASSTWSQGTKAAILETLVQERSLEGIQYSGMFAKKDKRRSELCVAVFYDTVVKRSGTLYNAFTETDENCDKLFALLPSFRTELLYEASQKDKELGIEPTAVGSYVKALKDTIGELPQDLQALYDTARSLTPRFEAILPSIDASDTETFETVNILPEAAKEFFK